MNFRNLDENAINIFTDGSSLARPRRGGVGAVIIWTDKSGREEKYEYQHVGFSGATNQAMEIKACTNVLRFLLSKAVPIQIEHYRRIVIFTDSMYIINSINKAKFIWPKTKWSLYS